MMSSVELMNKELDFLGQEIPNSIEHHDWTHEVFPEQLREIYDPEKVTIERYESIEDLVINVINPQSFSDLLFNVARLFLCHVYDRQVVKSPRFQFGSYLLGFQ